ncbi:copper amine oxidase N-terminal domain-containing protein [Paenibacillus polymyxa]|uniref:copper amine oxidase N-terminal domain-containing protein n=1 Tax=Paenibacillus polymyxa TaxID=1406 RepID=UPI001A0B3128|nr:copper amine oxidase N-terminal domain-containing protein [Paenibacillus polymyxa]MBE3650930.1 copper amine oxidase N-terminal domain-containing protein [Paenibacillus polymyxa]
MKKSLFVCSLILSFAMLTATGAMAASSQKLSLNINGSMANGQNPIVMDNVTLVPIRTVSLIPNLKVDWVNKSKTVTVTESDTKNKLKLTVGSNSAYVNDKKVSVGVNPTVKEGAVYVPFRFIGEALNAKVLWNSDTKTVVIYKPSQTLLQRYASNKLEESRNAAIQLPRISLHKELASTEEGGDGGTYYFPQKQSNNFIYAYRGIAQYAVVIDGAAWFKWEGQISTSKPNKSVIPNVLQVNNKEWGDRPIFTGKIDFFKELWKTEQVKFGTFDENGKIIYEGEKALPNKGKDIIATIPAEAQ